MYHKNSPRAWQLSWVRRSDWQILTHNTRTFTTDDRFQLVRQKEGEGSGGDGDGERDDWALQIKYVTARDTGVYECQVRFNICRCGTIRIIGFDILRLYTTNTFHLSNLYYTC